MQDSKDGFVYDKIIKCEDCGCEVSVSVAKSLKDGNGKKCFKCVYGFDIAKETGKKLFKQ